MVKYFKNGAVNMILKKFEDLTISDNFMFQKVMQDADICKEFIEKLLHINIKTVNYIESEKSIVLGNKSKGIRLDVYVETDDGRIIDIEMQTSKENQDFGKRTRYYQGLIDLNTLNKGESYRKLKESYIIFVCTFDPFNRSRMIYTFRNACVEDSNLSLNDGTTKIFLNATGKIGNLDSDIESFLRYVNSGNVRGEFTNRIDERLRELKEREEIGVEYMTLDVMLQDVRDEAFDKGHDVGFGEGHDVGFGEGRDVGFGEGRDVGFGEGQFRQNLDNLKRLMKKMKMTLEEALDFSDIPEDERSRYVSALQKDSQ